jgi:hypothetical protein
MANLAEAMVETWKALELPLSATRHPAAAE